MSSYNGEKYIAEQIDSILAQKEVHIELFIRDDGSKDCTRDILSEYTKHYSNIHVDYGVNVGIAKSFLWELANTPECDYYSFSDQDDFWEENKLSQAVKLIKQQSQDIPVLYYSNLKVTDSKLNIIRTIRLDKRVQSLESVIMRKSIAGSTMVMNNKLRTIIKSRPVSENMLIRNHDGFIISLAYSLGGKVICDPNSYILYRQHENNTSSGSPYGIIPRIRKEYFAIKNSKGSEAVLAEALIDAWGEQLSPEARRTLELIAGYRENILSRLKIFCSGKFVTGNLYLTIMGKIKALFGLL